MNTQLLGNRALVAGASDGIGLAVAQELAVAGKSCTLLARHEDKLKRALESLAPCPVNPHDYIVGDLSDSVSLLQTMQHYMETSGNKFDILINNSGGPMPGPAHQAKLDDFLKGFNPHLMAFHTLMQVCLPSMKEKGFGRIVNIISTSVKQPIPGLGVSNTVRGAVASWAKTLAYELGPFGITVNNVLPGATLTSRLTAVLENKAKTLKLGIEEVIAEEQKLIPLRRFAQPAEIAACVGFLCSSAASYVNGINLPVDGGRTQCL